MKWIRGRCAARAARRAAEAAARREREQRAWHQFWDAINVAGGGTSIPYDPEKYQ